MARNLRIGDRVCPNCMTYSASFQDGECQALWPNSVKVGTVTRVDHDRKYPIVYVEPDAPGFGVFSFPPHRLERYKEGKNGE